MQKLIASSPASLQNLPMDLCCATRFATPEGLLVSDGTVNVLVSHRSKQLTGSQGQQKGSDRMDAYDDRNDTTSPHKTSSSCPYTKTESVVLEKASTETPNEPGTERSTAAVASSSARRWSDDSDVDVASDVLSNFSNAYRNSIDDGVHSDTLEAADTLIRLSSCASIDADDLPVQIRTERTKRKPARFSSQDFVLETTASKKMVVEKKRRRSSLDHTHRSSLEKAKASSDRKPLPEPSPAPATPRSARSSTKSARATSAIPHRPLSLGLSCGGGVSIAQKSSAPPLPFALVAPVREASPPATVVLEQPGCHSMIVEHSGWSSLPLLRVDSFMSRMMMIQAALEGPSVVDTAKTRCFETKHRRSGVRPQPAAGFNMPLNMWRGSVTHR